jgi:hypothetical protein
MCFAVMIGVPHPFENDLCGLLKQLKWGISDMWGCEECEVLGGPMV